MGLFSVKSSFVETTAGGRLRFTPVPPDPRWMRVAEAVSWVAPPIIVVASIADGSVDTLIVVIGVFWALAALSSIAGRISGRGNPSPPTEPFDVPEPLVAEVRRLLESDGETAAMRAVREQLGVGLVDSRRIVNAVAGH